MTETSKVDSSIDQNQEDIWNFAFGSNLHPEKLKGRANLKVKECFPGKLKDWRLAFNLRGISWLEPSMAGVEPAPGDEVHGVLLRMSPEEFRKLVLSEGETMPTAKWKWKWKRIRNQTKGTCIQRPRFEKNVRG